jgi:hypothetical protein
VADRKDLPRDDKGRYLRQYAPDVIKSRTFRTWVTMRQRCTDPKHVSYPDYGGRGITFCERWEFYPNFLADMGERPEGMTLDRINSDGMYEPGNCRWATIKQQARNQRNNHLVDAFGERKTLVEWTEDARCAVTFGVLRNRLVKWKWDAEKAIATPARAKLPNGQGPRYEQRHVQGAEGAGA